MNKKAKFMLVMLSAASVVAGAFGIAGCSSKKGGDDTQVSSVYAEYKAYAEANGQTVLTYEQWLETIKSNVTIKGDNGVTPSIVGGYWYIGETNTGVKASGEDGQIPSIVDGYWYIGETNTGVKAQGKDGEEGVGVDSIEMSQDGKSLVIRYTNGETDVITLPEQITHVHKYDDDVVVLIPPTDTADGLGYKKCLDDDHIELVVVKSYYDVKVTLAGTAVVEGINVVINGAKAATDSTGVARVSDIGYYNDYIVNIESDSYELVAASRTGSSFGGVDLELEVANKLGSGNVVPGEGYYLFSFTKSRYGFTSKSFTLRGGETEAKKYKLSSSADYCYLEDSNQNPVLVEGEYEVIVPAGKSVTLTASVTVTPSIADADEVSYLLKVEELEAPQMGSVEELAVSTQEGTTYELPDGNDWVYYSWTKTNSDYGSIIFQLNNAEAVFNGRIYDSASWTYSDDKVNVVSGTPITSLGQSYGYAYIFKVRATGANASFSFTLHADEGTSTNPLSMNKGVEATYDFSAEGALSEYSVWFKYTVPADGDYTVVPTKTSNVTVYQGDTDNYIGSASAATPFHFEAGDYYFCVSKSSDVSGFMLRDFEDGDYGASAAFALEVELDDDGAQLTSDNGTKYYKVVANKSGLLRVTLEGSGSLVVNGVRSLTEVEVEEGDVVTVNVNCSYSSPLVTATVRVLGDDELAEDHVFTVSSKASGTAIAGATVKVTTTEKDQDDKDVVVVIAKGVTDAQGKVTLNFIPGSYNVTVEKEGCAFDIYDPANKNGSVSSSTREYNLNLIDVATHYTFTVTDTDETKKFESATLVFTNNNTNQVVNTITTDKNGVAEGDFLLPEGDLYYTVTLDPNDPESENYVVSSTSLLISKRDTSPNVTVKFEEAVAYTFTVKDADGTPLAGVSVNLTTYMDMWGDGEYVIQSDIATVVTNSNGVAVLKTKAINDMGGMIVIGVSVKDLAAGYSFELKYIATTDYNVDLDVVGKPVSDDDPANKNVNGASTINFAASAAVSEGENTLVNADEVDYYMFTAEADGTYTFVFSDAGNAGFVSLLSYGKGTTATDFTKLIDNGKEVSVACNLILGANRGFNKAYEFTVTLKKDQAVAIGYNTATEEGASAYLTVTNLTPPSEEPSVDELHEGENVIALTNGTATVTFEYTANEIYYLIFDDEVITIHDEEDPDNALHYGYEISWGADLTFTFIITADSSVTSATVTISTEQPQVGPGGRK